MNNEATLLEKEIKKSVTVREKIGKILTDNYPIEKDFADLIALEATNSAIGTDRIEKYNTEKVLAEQKAQKIKRYKEFKEKLKNITIIGLTRVLPAIIAATIILSAVFGMGSCIYSCATAPTYPRTYKPLAESTRFEYARSRSLGDTELNKKIPLVNENDLNDYSHLCVKSGINGIGRNNNLDSLAPICVNTKKLESLNAALDKAVKEDINGIIWNEPNGNGEIWTVERNNWRFIITATADPNYKE